MDEATIIDILTKRTNAQRQQIKAAYLQEKGKVGWSGKFTYLISVAFVLNMGFETRLPSSYYNYYDWDCSIYPLDCNQFRQIY